MEECISDPLMDKNELGVSTSSHVPGHVTCGNPRERNKSWNVQSWRSNGGGEAYG